MRKSDYSKAPYVDISYGWQTRGEVTQFRHRRQRWAWVLLAGSAVVGVVAGWLRWWG